MSAVLRYMGRIRLEIRIKVFEVGRQTHTLDLHGSE
jgi:hypothetical protein